MSAQLLEVSEVSPGVAALQLSTEAEPYLTPGYVDRLGDAVRALDAFPDLRVVVFRGGANYFSAGASASSLTRADSGETVRDYVSRVPRLLLSIPVPTIAAMQGHAVGGGLLLGFWASVPVLSAKSLYGANFMALGFTPGMGSTRVLETHFGASLAARLLFTGQMLKGDEIKSLACPLSHAVVEHEEVWKVAVSLAHEIADVPRDALRLLNQTLNGWRRDLLETAISRETVMHGELFGREDVRERIRDRYAGVSDG